jgi:hypothetical protein
MQTSAKSIVMSAKVPLLTHAVQQKKFGVDRKAVR